MIEKAIVLFTSNPVDESRLKQFGNSHVISKKVLDLFNEQIINKITSLKESEGFDFIISSDKYLKDKKGADYFIHQKGNNFGERFINCTEEVFNLGYKKVVIIGNDIPDLSTEIIQESFDRLKYKDVVAGPSEDGGFYLIGLTKFDDKLFDNIEWQTSKVFTKLLENIFDTNYSLSLLEELTDIDNRSELLIYITNKNTSFKKLITLILFRQTHSNISNQITFHKESQNLKRFSQKDPPRKFC